MNQMIGNLIALVATAVVVNGERFIVEPGQELPELSAHDAQELLTSGAAMDPAQQATTEKRKQQEEALALQSFREARERVQAEQASTTTEAESEQDGSDPHAKAAAKTAGKTPKPKE